MSKIAFVCESNIDLQFLAKVKKITGQSLGELKSKFDSKMPFVEALLFENDHEEKAAMLKKIADEATKHNVDIQVYELEPDEDFETCPQNECKINIDIMNNIFDEWQRRSDQF